jgi:molybdopterin synthase catalytic subunit
MHALSIVGHSETGKTTLIERLTEHLSEHGRVGTVKHINCEPDLDTEGKDTERHRSAGAVQTYGIGEQEWVATGDSSELDLHDALERLSERCEYALVEGYSDLALPTVVLGDRTVDRGEIIARESSGGEANIDAIVESLQETEQYETLASLVAEVKRSPDEEFSGAIATFTGRVRAKDAPDDERTECLEFEKYDEVAEQKMGEIRKRLEGRDGVYEVRLHHKTGVVEAGEDIVFVVVLAGHRAEAFETVEDGINRLKEIVPLFKKELTVGEEFWAHER